MRYDKEIQLVEKLRVAQGTFQILGVLDQIQLRNHSTVNAPETAL